MISHHSWRSEIWEWPKLDGCRWDARWGCSYLKAFRRLPEAASKVAYSGGWQIRAGCWREASILCEMDISRGLLDRANGPRESKMEAALPQSLAFRVTLQRFLTPYWLRRPAPVSVGRATQERKQEVGTVEDHPGGWEPQFTLCLQRFTSLPHAKYTNPP